MSSLVSSSLLLWLRYSSENGLKKVLKWIQMGLKVAKMAPWKPLGGLLGVSWGRLGCLLAPRPIFDRFLYLLWGTNYFNFGLKLI